MIVQGVSGTPGAMGYFGYTYYEENTDTPEGGRRRLRRRAASRPRPRRPRTATYTPLARPLFIYVNNKSYADKAQVAEFVDFYIDSLPTITEAAQFIALNDEQTLGDPGGPRGPRG